MSHNRLRAARLTRPGSPLSVDELDLAEPGSDEVRVELAFGGVNPVDRYTAEGRVAPDGPLPRTLGAEAAGTLDGQPVLVAGSGLGAVRDGVWATAANVPRSAVFPLPEGVDPQAAAGMGIAGLTAWNVTELGAATADDRALVLGASGGVGMVLVSLLASIGCTLWGQVGTAKKAAAVQRQGATNVVVTDAAGLADAVRELAPTVVFDCLGDGFTTGALSVLSPSGRLVMFGASAGADVQLNLLQLYRNGQQILGYTGIRLTNEERRRDLTAALQALAAGRMNIPVDRVLPLEQVNDAFRALVDRAVTGKILLDLS
jgi:NADPH2:quinone reductase